MMNKRYDPQAESLKDFWNSQQERLALLSGMTITDDIVKLTADFGEGEIRMFEKLMQTQKQLAQLLEQATVPTQIYERKRIPNVKLAAVGSIVI